MTNFHFILKFEHLFFRFYGIFSKFSNFDFSGIFFQKIRIRNSPNFKMCGFSIFLKLLKKEFIFLDLSFFENFPPVTSSGMFGLASSGILGLAVVPMPFSAGAVDEGGRLVDNVVGGGKSGPIWGQNFMKIWGKIPGKLGKFL